MLANAELTAIRRVPRFAMLPLTVKKTLLVASNCASLCYTASTPWLERKPASREALCVPAEA